MSLRGRVVVLIGGVLFVSVLVGALMAGWHAKQALHADLESGMIGAVRTVVSAFEDLPTSDHPARDLHQLVETFNGNRHVAASLVASDGRTLVRSTADPAGHAPSWFTTLLGRPPAAVWVAVPGHVAGSCCIVLSPTGQNDVGAIWREFLVLTGVLAGSSAVGLVLVYFTIGAALRPLDDLVSASARIGSGDYASEVSVRGPPEIARLGHAFNDMVHRLQVSADQNRALERQINTLQDEERAEIARDLHDEVGPYLFAAAVDTGMLNQLIEARGPADALDSVKSIQISISRAQKQVRELLGRLRPTPVTELGLISAVQDLVGFWAARRPEVRFEVGLPHTDAAIPDRVKEAAYRVVQESLNNALRHAQPSHVAVRVTAGPESFIVEISNDGVLDQPPNQSGLGLIGMRERVGAAGGQLSVMRQGSQWSVHARMPIQVEDREPIRAPA